MPPSLAAIVLFLLGFATTLICLSIFPQSQSLSCCVAPVASLPPLLASLSGQGVELGDSVLWILPWPRSKLLRPSSATTNLFFFLTPAPQPIPTLPPDLSTPPSTPHVSLFFLSICKRKLSVIHHSHCLMGRGCSLPDWV